MIFAVAYRSISAHLRALKPGGIYVSTGGPAIARIFQDMLIGPGIFRKESKNIEGGWVVNLNKEDLIFVKGLIETGKIKPVIDRIYPLKETAEAFRYFEKGHSRGKVIITI
jgi:NADPH:quinone reductase-like Zn-dependent oxidoreductase